MNKTRRRPDSPGYTHRFPVQQSYEVRPIGVISTPHKERFGTPRQPNSQDGDMERTQAGGVIEIFTDFVPAHAFADLEGFERVWLLSLFHLNEGWKPRVMPPRGPRELRGLYSTRSPHRPNRIGLSCCELREVSEGRIVVGPVDLLDGTPILDIKPYLPGADAHPDAAAGWVDEI